MVYFIGDTHFSEEAIIRYENRPFKDAAQMDKALISYWNSVMEDDAEVWHLGDFGAEGHEKEILSQLKGIKYLVKGNHDTNSNSYYRKAGFVEVYDKPVIFGNFWILSHEPMYVNQNMPYANIFAHVHKSPIYRDFSRHHYCASAERIDYRPMEFINIMDIMKGSEI